MTKPRHTSKLASYLLLTRKKDGRRELLCQLRQNTGYMDGFYDVSASGHVEKHETFSQAIIREAKEEIGIDLKESDLTFLHVNQQFTDLDNCYVDVYFGATKFSGEPSIKEPEKCRELIWADLDHLPENFIPRLRNVLACIKSNIPYDDETFTFLNRHA